MSIYTAAASAVPRLPLSLQDFCVLLRSYEPTTRAPTESRPVNQIDARESNVRSQQSGDDTTTSNGTYEKPSSWSGSMQYGGNGANNPCDSPHQDPDPRIGIDLWA